MLLLMPKKIPDQGRNQVVFGAGAGLFTTLWGRVKQNSGVCRVTDPRPGLAWVVAHH
jgi:hypothetical protein